ncbi:type II toxin-antitoxin system RelE/ParE family toxin [Polaribacter batillariae]|uniref:Type II toxin-antitoxin system RelE/ParE family toxin n=2 Tax=Polaribacter batillariae TaxID=2808900 RepID=A0ABX7SSX3_9FLAO|nr:type II toxin-antitoxin system RelE/ParE family toxin [Polaribacter batillariae]
MDSLLGIYNYIFEKSPQNALMVFNELTKLGDSLSNNKIEYSKDLIINDKAVRFVSKWDYKIIYERKENRVLIIDVFSSKQNPNKLILD